MGVKPSEQFAEIKATIEGMDNGKDKTDLLILFKIADRLHERVKDFDRIIHNLKAAVYNENKRLEWLKKWRPMLERFDNGRREE